jgi:hypothetical protein
VGWNEFFIIEADKKVPGLATGRAFSLKFKQEMYQGTRLSVHPNIVPVDALLFSDDVQVASLGFTQQCPLPLRNSRDQ